MWVIVISVIAVIAVISIICALKWYIAASALTYILVTRGIEPSESEMKDAAKFITRLLFKMR